MARIHLSVKEFFPIIQQILLDAFDMESFLMEPPYLDYERFDRGIRKMIWGSYSTDGPIFSLDSNFPYQIVVLESSLGFYNIAFTLDDQVSPLLGGVMPFRTEAITQAGILRIMSKNHIPSQHLFLMQKFYDTLPVADIHRVTALLQHTISFFIPDYENCHLEYVNYRSETHVIQYSEERFRKFSADYAEELNRRMEACCRAVLAGDLDRALEAMRRLHDFAPITDVPTLFDYKQDLFALNTFLMARMLETSIHPSHILQQRQAFQLKITETKSMKELEHLPFEIVRKYAILARNFTYDRYSMLIRSIINYIDQHLSSELTLSVIAKEFHKNPSYLSNAFRKEVGDTLTRYIGKQRIQASLQYFNTTSLSVAEVANAVGIPDFGYFSKLFRRSVGVSPREYKKMLDK